jgi:hypothetical protein
MGITPVYQLPYPESSDPADVPIDMRELAERMEAILIGGSAAVRAYHNAAQPVNHQTDTALAFNSERFDLLNGVASTQHDAASPTRLTCRQLGRYQITGHLEWANNATGARRAWIRLNGTAKIAVGAATDPTSDPLGPTTVTTIWDLVVGDFVELVVWHNIGAALNVTVGGSYSPEFMMHRVG